jgi:hypothetical protein
MASSELFMRMSLLRHDARPKRGGILNLYRRLTDFDQHKWMYDEEGLLQLFSESGFVNAYRREFLSSRIPRHLLSLVEQEDRICGGTGVCIEAVI